MSRRLYVPLPLTAGDEISLPPDTARHVQVLRLQPGDELRLFNGDGQEWPARVLAMGRKDVQVGLAGAPLGQASRELARHITLAVGMPANERMDALVEKATELGAAALQPLHCARSVLRLQGERAERRRAHWQGVAIAAAEQCGRTHVPELAPVTELATWLHHLPTAADAAGRRGVLSLAADAQPLSHWAGESGGAVHLLSGPEGGLAPDEEALARAAGFQPVSLGPRVLRADTAPLAALVLLGAAGRWQPAPA